jgi:glycosyltransferase involved in cell wall biosynthesis
MQADIFHVRSGAGQGGAIKRAKRKNMKIVADHSIAHPLFMRENVLPEYTKYGIDFNITPTDPFWHDIVLKDCDDADLVLVNSDFVKQTFIEAGFPNDKLRVVYLGVREDFIGIKTSYSVKKPVRLLFTGGLVLRKGIEYLIAAMADLSARSIPYSLTVVGEVTDEMKPIFNKHRTCNLPISFIGHVDQDALRGFLSQADMYVFPSLGEGCASSGMEALAAGLCVVATKESGLPISDGTNGYLVPSRDSKAIADRITWLYENPANIERVGREAMRMIRSNYTWDMYADKVIGIYGELVKR